MLTRCACCLQPRRIDAFLTLYRYKKNSKMRNRERSNPEVTVTYRYVPLYTSAVSQRRPRRSMARAAPLHKPCKHTLDGYGRLRTVSRADHFTISRAAGATADAFASRNRRVTVM